MHIEWQKIIDNCGLFWQYPVITEKEFYNQNKTFAHFLPFPWATVLDKNIEINQVSSYISRFISLDIQYYTCCQHIRFRELIPLFQDLGIKKVYTPHKCLEEDYIRDIELAGCPLYAVNFEDKNKNSQFSKTDFINKNRELLFSFIGGLQPGYLTDTRGKIFKLPKSDNTYVENTGGWHFNEIVYSEMQNKEEVFKASDHHKINTEKYNSVLLNSKFSLCPSGTGPNSIRFWESLACGSIPVLLADTLELPEHDLWEKAIVRIEEKDCEKVHQILSSISEHEQRRMRESCLKIYNYFKDNYANKAKKHSTPITKSIPIMVPISLGELIDKITILQIKTQHLQGTALENVKKELEDLKTTLNNLQLNIDPTLIHRLKEVNQDLWHIEDEIRDQERQKSFGETFIRLARSVYQKNDHRAAVKKEINTTYGSALVEEKSYQKY